jgi:hypothetical protein
MCSIALFVHSQPSQYRAMLCSLTTSPSHPDFQSIFTNDLDTLAKKEMLPNSESWDVCTFKAVDLKDLPAQAIASLEHVKSDGARIYEVRQEEEKSQRSALRKSALREKRSQYVLRPTHLVFESHCIPESCKPRRTRQARKQRRTGRRRRWRRLKQARKQPRRTRQARKQLWTGWRRRWRIFKPTITSSKESSSCLSMPALSK